MHPSNAAPQAVHTVLKMAEAMSVPSDQNITVQTETRVTSHVYSRDLAITAVVCLIGGAGLTLLAVLVCYEVSRRKKRQEGKRQKDEEEGSETVVNHHVNHVDVGETRRDALFQASSSKQWDREARMLDTRLENNGGQFQSRMGEDGSHFMYPDCGTKGQRAMGLNAMKWNNRINKEVEAEEGQEKRRVGMRTEEERRMTQQRILSRDTPSKRVSLGNFSSSSHPWRETYNERPKTLQVYKTGRDMDSYGSNVEGKSIRYESVHCASCHRTYRAPEQAIRPGRSDGSMRDAALFNGFPPQHRVIDRSRNVTHNTFDMVNTESKRESRNVTFDLESLRTLEEVRTSRDKEKGREKRHKAKIQPGRLLKVKLNLNLLRKSKVHPKRKNEQDHSEISSSKKNEKRQNVKERQEKEGTAKSGKKTSSSEKVKKSTCKASSEDGGVNGEEGKGRMTSVNKKTTEGEPGESMAGDEGENTQPDNSQSGNTSNVADPSASASAKGQTQNSQGGMIPCQGAGFDLGTLVLSQNHFSTPAAQRNRAASLSLPGSAGSQLAGSNLSLQGGNFLLNTMTPGLNALFPGGPANSVAPSIAISGPNLVSSSALGSFNRQTDLSLKALATSLLANPFNALHTPLHNPQTGGLVLDLAANPAVNSEPSQALFQSQLLPDSFPLVAKLKSDPAQGPGLQTGEALHQLPNAPQAALGKESLLPQLQVAPNAESSTQALGSVTSVENLPNNSQAETEVSAVNVLTDMLAVAPTEGPAAGVTGGSVQAADVSGVSGSSADAADAAVLLHQEYLPEEGDSSPRRKLRLALPEKTSSRPLTALERKLR